MVIKHMVLSGGGPRGLRSYGIIKELHKKNFWSLQEIESFFCCSIGIFIILCIVLEYNWDDIDDFLIKRPWQEVFEFEPDDVFELYTSKGLFSKKVIIEVIKPLLSGKDLTIDITLKELYEFTNKKIFMTVTNMNEQYLKKEMISHETHPELKLVDAMAMTSCIPFLFEPIFYKGGCYLDGGIICNFPLIECMEYTNCKEEEILAIRFSIPNYPKINETTNILDFMNIFLKKTHNNLEEGHLYKNTKYTIICNVQISSWSDILKDSELRRKLIHEGEEDANVFLLNTCI